MDRRILFFLLSALFLYLAGVLSGILIGKELMKSTEALLKTDIYLLSSKTDELEKRMETAVQTLFPILLLEDKNVKCSVLYISMNDVLNDISGVADNLPYRLEEADVPSSILEKYTSLGVRAFMIADFLRRECNVSYMPALYVYEKGNIDAALEMDRLKREFNLMVFVASADVNNPFIKAIDADPPYVYVCGGVYRIPEAGEVLEACKRG